MDMQPNSNEASGRARASTGQRRRDVQAGTKTSFNATKQRMKPFSGFHEAMVKPPAIKWTVGNDGPRGAA